MNLIVRIPDEFAARMAAAGDIERRALEGLALGEYRSGRLTRPELRRMLGFGTRGELDGFLKDHGVDESMTLAEFERQRQDLARLGVWSGVRIVVADTSPLHYLVLIAAIDVLPRLFTQVMVPMAVRNEMRDAGAPLAVRHWIDAPPPWLTVQEDPADDGDATLQELDRGERAAIVLAAMIHADLVLMDDRAGVAAARARGLVVTGTLGIVDLAAARGLIDPAKAVEALRATNFHIRQALIDALLARHGAG